MQTQSVKNLDMGFAFRMNYEKVQRGIPVRPKEITQKEDFREFTRQANPRFQFYKHCELLADALEKVANGTIKRLLVQLPPRHSKSEMVSRLFAAYYLKKNPQHFVGINSYSAELAYTLSRAARENFIRTGGLVRDDVSAVKHWETEQGGGMWAAGVGGSITGKGFHCFPADTKITTELGEMKISTLYLLQNRPKVLSYNHLTKTTEWKKVAAAVKYKTKGLYEITTKTGRKIQSTGDHQFFTKERGYVEAQGLNAGERFITSTLPKQQNLPELRKNKKWPRFSLSELLPIFAVGESGVSLLILQQIISTFEVSAREVSKTKLQRFLLLKDLFKFPPFFQESKAVPNLLQTSAEKYSPLLLGGVSAQKSSRTDREWKKISGSELQSLSINLHAEKLSFNVLQQDVCQQSPLFADDRSGELTLQNRHELCEMVSGNAPADFREGQEYLCGLFSGENLSENKERAAQDDTFNSPYRRESSEQYDSEFSNALRNLPFSSSPLGTDTVELVERIHDESVEVYDIEVEGNHNFFANEILTHNCGIIDDPIKNAEEANSETIREKHKEWYSSTFYTRAEPDAAIIIIQTRWHEDDLTGWILSEEQGDEPENWHIVSLPAFYSTREDYPASCTVEPDFRTVEGEALCPERYPEPKLKKIRARIGEYYFDALYQQQPISKSGLMFDVTMFSIVDAVPVGTKIARGWDKAATPGGGDFTVGVKLGKCPDDTYIVIDVERGQWDTATRDRTIRSTAENDGASVKQYGEQEPGSAGVSDANAFIKLLAGYPVEVEKVSGDKVTRADAFSSQVNAGNVKLLRGDWNKKYKDELQNFPKGKNDDQVDGSSLAFNKLATEKKIEVERFKIR